MSVANRAHASNAEAASGLAARGWRVVPCHTPDGTRCSCRKGDKCSSPGKHPRTRRGVHDATEGPEVVRDWWKRWPLANIGIATGAESNIVVLDVDPRHGGNAALAELEANYGPLPPTLTARTGDAGRHLYFSHPGGAVGNSAGELGPGLDVRAGGGMVIAPPSLHWPHRRYEWTGNAAETAQLPDWLLATLCHTPSAVPTCDRDTEKTEKTEKTDDTEAITPRAAAAAAAGTLEEAIAATIPRHDQPATRNRRIFDFARRLRGMTEFANADARKLKKAVKAWHAAALPFIQTKALDDSWSDFVYAWPRVRHAYGEGTVTDALRRATAAANPPAALQYDAPATRLLVRLCAELQRAAGDAPFYLACRTAGDAVGWDRMTSARRLNMLVADNVLVVVEPATKTRAPRFRFHADAEGGE